MTCTDKFGNPVSMPGGTEPCDFAVKKDISADSNSEIRRHIRQCLDENPALKMFEYVRDSVRQWSFDEFRAACRIIADEAVDNGKTDAGIETLTMLNDRRYPIGSKKRSHVLHIVRQELDRLFGSLPFPDAEEESAGAFRLIDFKTRDALRPPRENETTLVIDASRFLPEGDDCDAALLLDAYMMGWRRFICFGYLGQRFTGCGLGPETEDVAIDVYGSSGDYLGSGIDGLTLTVHNNAQDQLGQIIKSGKMVVYGDVGQAFMYGAKGGDVYVLGNAAGRPLINGVGRPKVVINGTCLDFLAEAFMAGDPHKGGGFVILNGVEFDDDGHIVSKPEPYPGSNLFSLASGGAIYVRDPLKRVIDQQLNGGIIVPFTDKDWELIAPYLEENESLFGITIEDLLTFDDKRLSPAEVYRKVAPARVSALSSGVADVFVDDKTVEEIIME